MASQGSGGRQGTLGDALPAAEVYGKTVARPKASDRVVSIRETSDEGYRLQAGAPSIPDSMHTACSPLSAGQCT